MNKEGDLPTLQPQNSSVLSTEPTIPQTCFSIPKQTFCQDKTTSQSSRFTQNLFQPSLNEPKLISAPRNSQTNEDIIKQTLKMFKRIKQERNNTTGCSKQSRGQQPQDTTQNSSRSSSTSSSNSQSTSFSSDEKKVASPHLDSHQVWDNSELKENGYFNLDELTNFQVFKLRMMTYPCMRQPQISNTKVVEAFVKLQKVSKHMNNLRITKQLKVDRTQNQLQQTPQGQALSDQLKQWQNDQTQINLDLALSAQYQQFSSFFKTTVETEKRKQRPQKFQRYDKSTFEVKDVRKRGKELIKKQFLQLIDEHQQQTKDLSPEKKLLTKKESQQDLLDEGNAAIQSTHSRLSLTGTSSPVSNAPSISSFSQIPQGSLSPAKVHNSPNCIVSRHFLIRKVSEMRQFNSTPSNCSPSPSLISKQPISQMTQTFTNFKLSEKLNTLKSLDGITANTKLSKNSNQGSNIPTLSSSPSQANNSPYSPSIGPQFQQGRKLSSPIVNFRKTESPSFHENSEKEVIPFSSNLTLQKRASSYHSSNEYSGQESKIPFLNSLQSKQKSIEISFPSKQKVNPFTQDWQAIPNKQNLDMISQSKLSFMNINTQANEQQYQQQQVAACKITLERQSSIEAKNQINEQKNGYQSPNSPQTKHKSMYQRRNPSLHLTKQMINNFPSKATFSNNGISDLPQETLIKSAQFRLNASPAAFTFNNENIINSSKSSSPHRKPFQQYNPTSYFSPAAVKECINAPSPPYSLQRFKFEQFPSDIGNGVSLLKLISTQSDANSSQQEQYNNQKI